MVVVLGQDEARHFKHNYIGTEHLLLGLLREEEGLAGRVLESLDVTLEDVRAQVARIVGHGDEVKTGQIPFTPRAKKVLELALRESVSLGHNHIGTEHILLGIVRENEGVASRILLDLGADAEKVRNEVIRCLSGPGRFPRPIPTPVPPELVDLPPQLQAEIMRVRRKKERAIENQSFERAARLREREGRLVKLARAGDHEAFWEYVGRTGPEPPPAPTPLPPVAAAPAARWPLHAVAAGWLLFGVALGIGLLIGRLVWG
jgi:Clp amino terminal domain, pathogenicity island component/UvrB/uvrC motif